MTVGTPQTQDFQTQTGTAYKTAIDNNVAVAKALTGQFAPHEQSSPNMTVRLDAGKILSGTTLTSVAAQSTSTITAPVGNPRIDRVVIDISTGAVSVITGTPAGSPTAPAITSGKLPICQVLIQTSSTAIDNTMITDERPLTLSGGVSDGDKGDITVSSAGAVWTIDNDVVTYAKMQNVSATSRILGRKTAAAGDTEECTLSEILDFIGSAAQGDILYRGSSAWARLAAGTSGYHLRTQGAGANPIWEAPASTVLLTQTASSSSTVDFTGYLTNAYSVYKIFIYDMQPASAGIFQMQFGNGGSYITSNYAYAGNEKDTGGGNSVINGTAQAQINLTANSVSTSSTDTHNWEITIYNPSHSKATGCNFQSCYFQNSGNILTGIGGGHNTSTTAVTDVRFKMASGNITAGTFKLVGYNY